MDFLVAKKPGGQESDFLRFPTVVPPLRGLPGCMLKGCRVVPNVLEAELCGENGQNAKKTELRPRPSVLFVVMQVADVG